MEKYWKDQLDEVLNQEGDERDGMFGTNIDWEVKDVRRFITKLEALGAADIKIPDHDTISFTLPESEVFALKACIFILTSSPMPIEVSYNKNKDRLTLRWDY
jgi:hypothetical protein